MSTNGSLQNVKDKVISGKMEDWEAFEQELNGVTQSVSSKINADPDNAENGLISLVLALVDMIRKLMERQAIRRVESGSLSEDEIENLGLTLMKLEEKMEELKDHFGLTDDDLTLDLGPLGRIE